MNKQEQDTQEHKSLQRTTTYKYSLLASRKRLFEAANYLLCQLALQIQELERTNTNGSEGEQAEEKTPK